MGFEYTVRLSKRAKRLSLKVSLKKGLEVVVPDSIFYRKYLEPNSEKVKVFLEENISWINKHLEIINKSSQDIEFPNTIILNTLKEEWQIKYLPLRHNDLTEINIIKTLMLSYNAKASECNQTSTKILLIKNWLIKKSESYFLLRAKYLATKNNLSFNSLKIKGQETLWGTCDGKKNICLNYKLLFLPQELSDHIILHELCHTVHLNHSICFKTLLKALDPNYYDNLAKIKKADRYIPMLINKKL